MREFRSGGAGVHLQESDCSHDEARHTEGALEPLFVDNALPDRMQASVLSRQAFDRQDFLIAYRMGENRTRVMRHVADQDCTSAALGAVAP